MKNTNKKKSPQSSIVIGSSQFVIFFHLIAHSGMKIKNAVNCSISHIVSTWQSLLCAELTDKGLNISL